jgi:hypothetical protein
MTSIFMKMEDKLIFFLNGRRPQFVLKKADDLNFFEKEDDLNCFENGRQTQKIVQQKKQLKSNPKIKQWLWHRSG